DDEPPARERLRRLCAELPGLEVAGEAGNGPDAIELVQDTQADAVLLDIRMPAMDGIEVARHLAALESPPAVIFVTAYDQYALEAFEAQASAYLLKPIRRDKLAAAVQAAQRLTRPQLAELAAKARVSEARRQIAARVRDRIKLIPVSEVRYFLADQKYVTVRHAQGEDLIEESLKTLEDEFGAGFVRVHRNALVAVSAVEAVERGEDGQLTVIIKQSGERLPVSRRLAAEALRKLRG
ncbi:MAG: LytTR family DNA-binding domain-containing protein, partial [Planctomycetota bacterium]